MLKNQSIVKNPHFSSNPHEIWWKRLSLTVIIFTKFREKYWFFLETANFWTCPVFFTQTLKEQKNVLPNAFCLHLHQLPTFWWEMDVSWKLFHHRKMLLESDSLPLVPLFWGIHINNILQYWHTRRKLEMMYITTQKYVKQGTKDLTCKMTSTSYWLPLDFWCPTNLDPLYNNELVTPGCFDLMGGKGCATFISVGMLRTGILTDL